MKFLIPLFVLALSACASMQKDYQNRICHYSGAFEEGVNGAQAGQPMAGENLAQQCPQPVQDDVRRGYRDGYMSIRNLPPEQAPLIVINGGGGHRDKQRERQCLTSYGQQVCGYGCIEAYGKARCAQNPRHTCSEFYGQIYCGTNCHEDYGQVHCDEIE
jgi:hypothetical protein